MTKALRALQIPPTGQNIADISAAVHSAYCSCSELVVGMASRGKMPHLDAFDSRQIVGARPTVSRVYQESTAWGQITSDRANCKGQTW
ncbi:hypothetical protein TNCV_3810561 [Trichonephila clavipes]|nr:hypothetical protein TNCV_3810561 [Trichonephila clavipes]